mmetsp:Transcript_28858/g.93883  ORF Transcript_28858/g.93883 Transcript_28858/m.93883 type:complete len:235 (-) Transcript_28858:170-874(-)
MRRDPGKDNVVFDRPMRRELDPHAHSGTPCARGSIHERQSRLLQMRLHQCRQVCRIVRVRRQQQHIHVVRGATKRVRPKHHAQATQCTVRHCISPTTRTRARTRASAVTNHRRRQQLEQQLAIRAQQAQQPCLRVALELGSAHTASADKETRKSILAKPRRSRCRPRPCLSCFRRSHHVGQVVRHHTHLRTQRRPHRAIRSHSLGVIFPHLHQLHARVRLEQSLQRLRLELHRV